MFLRGIAGALYSISKVKSVERLCEVIRP